MISDLITTLGGRYGYLLLQREKYKLKGKTTSSKSQLGSYRGGVNASLQLPALCSSGTPSQDKDQTALVPHPLTSIKTPTR